MTSRRTPGTSTTDAQLNADKKEPKLRFFSSRDVRETHLQAKLLSVARWHSARVSRSRLIFKQSFHRKLDAAFVVEAERYDSCG